MIKTAKELVAACLDVVNNYKTMYVLSCFGAPMNEKNKSRYAKADPKRAAEIMAADADTFGFDCVCFIKGLFWGWCGDVNHVYGGAEYKSNGVPDMSADAMIKACTDVSDDFSAIVPGELVWLPGHVGIYVGDGLAAESTFEPVSGVQLQAVVPIGWKDGYPATGWKKHGKLPWISYEVEENTKEDNNYSCNIYLPMLSNGSIGDAVRTLQTLLISFGYSCGWYGVDGEFGDATKAATMQFQKDKGIEVDGVVGEITWSKLLGV